MTGLKAFIEYLFHRDARMGRIESALASFQVSITELKLEIHNMGTTISEQQDANTAKITADLAMIKTGIEALQAQLAGVTAKAGETISQAQEDALAAAVATADGLAAVFAGAPVPAA